MTITKAKLFKTAIVCTDTAEIPEGTIVAVQFITGKRNSRLFRCTAPDGTIEVLHEFQLGNFVL